MLVKDCFVHVCYWPIMELSRFVYFQCSVVAFAGNASLGLAFKKEYNIHRTVFHIKFVSFLACILLEKTQCLTEKPFTQASDDEGAGGPWPPFFAKYAISNFFNNN